MAYDKGMRTWLRIDRAPHCQLQRQYCVAIPMTYPVASTIERPDVVLGCSCPCEMRRCGCTSRHLRRFIRVQRFLRCHGWLLEAWMTAYVTSCRGRLSVGFLGIVLLLLVWRGGVSRRRLEGCPIAVIGVLLLRWWRWRVRAMTGVGVLIGWRRRVGLLWRETWGYGRWWI